jgi:acyl carrier protein
MTNIDKYNRAFTATFGVSEKRLKKLKYQDVDAWDSVGHMNLITALEDAFNIMMETDDIIVFSSYQKGLEIMRKYGVGF